MIKRASLVALFCLATLYSQGMWASAFSWTHLDTAGPGTVSGTLTLGSQTVAVTYTSSDLAFDQINNTGTNWWSCIAITCPVYSHLGITPPDTVDMIAIDGTADTHTLTFSSPVSNPVLAIISLGQPSVFTTYYFDHPFTILTDGPGWWGGPGTLNLVSGNGLQGIEGDGLVQFTGTFSEISWTGANGEFWNGFNVGAPSAVPEPGSLALLGTGVLGVAGLLRRKFVK